MISEDLTHYTDGAQTNENSSWLMHAHSMASAPFVMMCTFLFREPRPPRTFHRYEALPEDLKKSSGISAFLTQKDIAALVVSKAHYRLFKPELESIKLLRFVARGQQNEAHRLLTIYHEFKFLLKKGTVTDHAGRTFKNITPYEYAYWAKDTHMCRMLERHMCDTTKAAMRACCEVIDSVGLDYEQHGKKVANSTGFDFTPLKTALDEFILGYQFWVNLRDHHALNKAWCMIGQAQRDLPAHVINEYCRRDRSFYPRPAFNEDVLPRALILKMKGSIYGDFGWIFSILFDMKQNTWFSLTATNITLFRGRGEAIGATHGMPVRFSGDLEDPYLVIIDQIVPREDLVIDLDAINYLDEVRSADRAQSRANLRRRVQEPHLERSESLRR